MKTKILQGQQITTLDRRKGVVVATNFSTTKPLLVRFVINEYEILSLKEIKE